METLINRMFINRWHQELSYEAFLQGCAARECTYTLLYRFDALDVITTCVSVFSGLSVALRFLVPHLIAIFTQIRQRLFFGAIILVIHSSEAIPMRKSFRRIQQGSSPACIILNDGPIDGASFFNVNKRRRKEETS